MKSGITITNIEYSHVELRTDEGYVSTQIRDGVVVTAHIQTKYGQIVADFKYSSHDLRDTPEETVRLMLAEVTA